MSRERIPNVTAFASPPRRALDYRSTSREQPLGRGGQAVVYRIDFSDGSPDRIALKEPLRSETLTAEAQEAFLSEANNWELVDRRERNRSRWVESEHIVGIIDTGEQLPWIAMEYMDGGGLDELVESNQDGIDVDRGLWTAECVAKGLEIAHENGIAHLDLKPDNVLFKSTGSKTWDVPKIADWGLARLLAKETGTMEALSPQYAAPEQFEPDVYGEPDTLTDVYQLGAVLYAMLTGDPPYTGSRLSVMRSVVDGDGPPNLQKRRNEVSKEVESAVQRALAAEKAERYASISEFRKTLEELRLSSRTISTQTSCTPADSTLHRDQTSDRESEQSARNASDRSTADEESNLTHLLRVDDESAHHLKLVGISSIDDLAAADDLELARQINRSPNEVSRWIGEAKQYDGSGTDWEKEFASSTSSSTAANLATPTSTTVEGQTIAYERLDRVDQDEANALALVGIQSLDDLADIDEIEVARQLDRSPNEIARWREEAQEIIKRW